MPKKYEIKGLLEGMVETTNGKYRYPSPPPGPSTRVPPVMAQMEQAFVVREDGGKATAYLCWSEEQIEEIDGGDTPKVFLGGFPPAEHHHPRLELGGDYPLLFEHLRDFQKTYSGPIYFRDYSGGGVCPTSAVEACGMIYGSAIPNEYRVMFFFDKQSARQLFAELITEHPAWGPITATMRPYLERSTLPETGGTKVQELGPQSARWLTCWYTIYRNVTGQIF